MAHLFKFAIANMEAKTVMGENNFTQKEMINKVMLDIDKLFEKLDQIQKDLATRPTRQEIYGWIIAGISIATLITVLM